MNFDYKTTSKFQVIATPSQFPVNKVSHEERLTNLCASLTDRSITVPAMDTLYNQPKASEEN